MLLQDAYRMRESQIFNVRKRTSLQPEHRLCVLCLRKKESEIFPGFQQQRSNLQEKVKKSKHFNHEMLQLSVEDEPEVIGALTVENVVIFHFLKSPDVQLIGVGRTTCIAIMHKESDVFAKLINSMINLAKQKTDQSYY